MWLNNHFVTHHYNLSINWQSQKVQYTLLSSIIRTSWESYIPMALIPIPRHHLLHGCIFKTCLPKEIRKLILERSTSPNFFFWVDNKKVYSETKGMAPMYKMSNYKNHLAFMLPWIIFSTKSRKAKHIYLLNTRLHQYKIRTKLSLIPRKDTFPSKYSTTWPREGHPANNKNPIALHPLVQITLNFLNLTNNSKREQMPKCSAR